MNGLIFLHENLIWNGLFFLMNHSFIGSHELWFSKELVSFWIKKTLFGFKQDTNSLNTSSKFTEGKRPVEESKTTPLPPPPSPLPLAQGVDLPLNHSLR